MAAGTDLAAVVFGVASAAAWGAGDFSGGLASKRTHVFAVVTTVHLLGVGVLLALAGAWQEPFPAWDDMAWGVAGGLAGVASMAAFYRALAVGQMGLAAPAAAVVATVISVGFAAVVEGLPGVVPMAGFGLGLASIWLIARPEQREGRPEGLGLALLAGVGFAGFGICMDRVSAEAVFWPLAAARFASSLSMLLVALRAHQPWHPQMRQLPLVLLAGGLDLAGNVFFLVAVQAGRLDVVAVLSSLYPAVTVLLARLVLDERVTRARALGIGAALVAVPLIAA